MRISSSSSLLALATAISLAVPHHAAAQEEDASAAAQAPADTQSDTQPEPTDDEIIVIANRLAGQIDAPEPPILELNTEDIAAYGAGSISDLIQALSSQVSGGGGRGGGFPVILVNGVRVSSFRELRSYPPEAIEKVEVFPETVAQRYGYSPDQRVVNFILKKNFSSRELELEYEQPWDGGSSTKEAEATYLRLIGPSRLNFNLSWDHRSLLTEAERGVEQLPESEPTLATDPDPALYRSLISPSTNIQATGNFTSRLGDGPTSLSLNATFERTDGLSYQGLDSVLLTDPDGNTALRTFGQDDPLTVDSRSNTYSLGATINSTLGGWQITGTADGSHAVSRSLTQRRADTSDLADAVAAGTLPLDTDISLPDAGFDRADTQSDSANSKITATGRPVLLPGGELSVTLDAGYDWTRIQSEDTRNPGVETSLNRGDLNGGINVSVPVTSRREDFGAALGDITLNLAGGLDHLSDFGTLTDWSLGLNWGLTDRLNFGVTYVGRDAAPSLSQLGAPEIATFNVPVYDLSRGETVLATVISGGNPDLPSQTQRDWRFSLNWQLPDFSPDIQQARLSVQYFNNSSNDVSAGFPDLSPPIEAAFPDRVTRCEAGDVGCVPGQLLMIDRRPVTFAQEKSQGIQIGLNMTGPFGKARPQAAAQAQANNPFAMMRQATQGSAAPASGGQGPVGGPEARGAPGAQGSGSFNPQVFQRVRERFCTPEAANTVPTAEDLAGLPEPLLERVKNPDGTINAERWAEARGGICNANFQQVDPARFAEMRERICGKPGETPPPITDEQLAALPPQMLERLKGPDGKVDPERLAQLRTRFCSADFGRGPQGGPPGQGGFIAGGPPPGGAPAGGPGAGPGGPGGGGRGPGGPGFGGPGGGSADGRGRWFFNLNYTYKIEDEVLIAPGGPLLDLLNGDALTRGGNPRHAAQFMGGLFYAGFGTNVNISYTGSSHINGSDAPNSTDLFVDDYVTVNFRLFADLNQRTSLIEQVPLLKNTRVTFGVNNVFDTRQRTTDGNGEVPLGYQPYIIDPVGRSFQIELRKLF